MDLSEDRSPILPQLSDGDTRKTTLRGNKLLIALTLADIFLLISNEDASHIFLLICAVTGCHITRFVIWIPHTMLAGFLKLRSNAEITIILQYFVYLSFVQSILQSSKCHWPSFATCKVMESPPPPPPPPDPIRQRQQQQEKCPAR